MPQQVEFERLDLQLRDQPQRLGRRIDGAERLLVAMAVQQRGPAWHRCERQVKAAGLALGGDKFLEQLARGRRAPCVSASGQHRREFVAQGQQAGRFETDDRGAGGDAGASASSMRRASLRASSTSPAPRKVRPQHSGRPTAGSGVVTRYPARVRTRSAARAFSGSK